MTYPNPPLFNKIQYTSYYCIYDSHTLCRGKLRSNNKIQCTCYCHQEVDNHI